MQTYSWGEGGSQTERSSLVRGTRTSTAQLTSREKQREWKGRGRWEKRLQLRLMGMGNRWGVRGRIEEQRLTVEKYWDKWLMAQRNTGEHKLNTVRQTNELKTKYITDCNSFWSLVWAASACWAGGWRWRYADGSGSSSWSREMIQATERMSRPPEASRWRLRHYFRSSNFACLNLTWAALVLQLMLLHIHAMFWSHVRVGGQTPM